jgi:hypothetical protein
MHATTPRLYFQTLFQHEVFVIMPERRLALHVMLVMATR